jgi:hypothetical protein
MTPALHCVWPSAAQAPTPHVVVCGVKSSSVTSLQLSSIPLQEMSCAAAVPGVQESAT